MKQLEITTNKRLLIVEIPEGKSSEEVLSEYKGVSGDQWDFLCKGSELTEDIAVGLVIELSDAFIPLYKNHNGQEPIFQALESFISAIEAAGYYWGENPVKEPRMSDYGWYASGHPEEDSGWMYEEGEDKYYESLKLFEEAESCTFNPEKCIIFEIV